VWWVNVVGVDDALLGIRDPCNITLGARYGAAGTFPSGHIRIRQWRGSPACCSQHGSL